MERFDISEWANQVPEQKAFRQAVHTILTAISGTPSLQETMIMKGGILLALAYESSRYTTDIDFSTGKTLSEFDAEEFIREFEGALMRSVEELDYGLGCLIPNPEIRDS